MASNQIEKLIAAGKWKPAQRAIEKRLAREPDNHWLWSRLSAVKYEQRDYNGALADAEKALEIVPDCPLALWDYAGALEMLGKPKAAMEVFARIFRRGMEELETPDEDADECWEGKDWTDAIVKDCVFRVAECAVKIGKPAEAEKFYAIFLDLLKEGTPGIYSREDAEVQLKKLKPNISPKELRQRANDEMRELVEVQG